MNLQEIVEMAQRVERVAARGVECYGDALTSALFVERPEIPVSNIAAAVVGIDHHADIAEFRHGPLHLLDGRSGVDVQRHERDTLEPTTLDRAPIIEPVIVGSA